MKFLLKPNFFKRASLTIEASKNTKLLNLNIEQNKIKEFESSELILPLKNNCPRNTTHAIFPKKIVSNLKV